MRSFRFGALAASLAALALSLVLVGCSKDKDDEGDARPRPKQPPKVQPTGKPPTDGGGAKAVFVPAVWKGTTTIKGRVVAKGNVKAVEDQLSKELRDKMNQAADEKSKRVCLGGPASQTEEQVYRVGTNNQVGNVFVWIAPEESNAVFNVPEELVKKAAASPVEIDQPHCAFVPHVAVYFAEYPDPKKNGEPTRTGQKFLILNSAEISHNTLSGGEGNNPSSNVTIPPGGKIDTIDLVPDTRAVMIKCNIHTWMNGYVRVFDHPFATVTKSDTAPKGLTAKKGDEDFGTFKIEHAPAGVKVRLIAWHEKAGYLTTSDGIPLDTKEGETPVKDLEMEVK
jgi:hypothetical protein